MKVQIDKNGILKISAENSTESYALKKWTDDQSKIPDNTQFMFPDFLDGFPLREFNVEDRPTVEEIKDGLKKENENVG